ncbi:MAG: aminotransferase class I/II-fold pyridoxal phosphate-dependent enzyme, partial [Thermoactinospora sp.]|nr:aminotransferase class I/II-fold pyridoxal phosphate-dependent enzyme [Thermoactinospora sp.]
SGFSGASVALENTSAPSDAAEHILAELRAADQDATPENRVNELRYRSGARWHRHLEPFEPSAPDLRLRDGGTYLITGGAGAIGLAVAGFLAGQGRVNLVLTGRSQLDDTTRARVEALPATYVRADVQSGADLARLVREHGPFHGVIHAAGVHRDARAVQKQRAEAESVLAPKVLGTVLLDEAMGDEQLDFLALFSSVAAETGNIGQVDYAYANAFLHHYAEMRERSRRGRTVAIGWPLWEEGGMKVDDATRRLFERRWGSVPMSTAAGLTAFARGLAGAESAFAVMEGPSQETDRSDQAEEREPAEQATGQSETNEATNDESDIDYGELVRAELRRAAAGFLLVGEEHVDLDTNLMDSGFDSISLSELVDQVNERYGLDLLPTVAFEASTLAAFGDFLVANHRPELARVHAAPRTQAPDEPVSAPEVTHPSPRSGAETSRENPDGIAVIGMAGTLPGSPDLETFWRHLADGDDLIRDVPEDRADLRENPDTAGVRAGFLDDVRSFDAALFGISPKEAALMDPQQRLFLQTVWRTIEDAGYRPSALAGTRTGLFAGTSACDYDDLLREHGVPVEAHTASGVAGCILANRVSHFLDLRGPSEAIDTACSSSLVALHRAVRAIEAGECETAIAGGVNLTLSPGLYIAFGKSGMISDDGTCKTFDERADGYGRGEGCGAVLLKPLSAALADGDQVLAVIKGSAVNHGGRASSLTAPNPEAQARVLVDAYRKAGTDPATVTYLEAHGTGTRLGDPIEIEGLKKAFAELYTDWDRPAPGEPHVAVTSVKTNIGHLEAAAGIAGLLKVLLCMKYGQLPATLHYDQPNPYLRLEGTPFFINDRLRSWDGVPGDDGAPVRRAGVSSFGFGGTNAHVVLEAYEQPAPASEDGPQVLVLSARTPEALDGYARDVARFLGEHPEIGLDRVAYTLQVGREPMRERLAVVVSDRDEAVRALAGEAGAPQVWRGRAGEEASGPAGDGLEELAQAWVEGAEVDWLERWAEPRPQRASVPSFPFERTEHWFKAPSPRQEERRQEAPRRDSGGREAARQGRRESSRPEAPRREPSRRGPSRQEPSRQDASGKPKVRLRAAGEGAPSSPDGNRRTRLASTGSKADGAEGNGRVDATTAADVATTAKAADAKVVDAPSTPPPTEQPPAGSAGGASGVEELLRERLATILDTDPSGVAPDTPFGDLGLDSIFRMELVKSLNTAFSLDLQASELYEYDTVDRLTRAVEEAINESTPAPAEPQQEQQQQPGAEEALTSLVSSVIGRPLDPDLTFEKNGLTSFEMLRTVSTLEKRAGALHKTLLFDHPTVQALAAHLGADALQGIEEQSAPDPEDQEHEEREGEPLVIAKRRLPQRPELREVIDRIDREHAKEGGLAGRDIAPLAFLGSARQGYLNFSRIDGNLLAWSYAGPEDHFLPLVEEYVAYAQGNGLKPNFLSLIPVTEVAGKPYTATPFGAVQRLENLGEFTLKGGRMERLRYMVRRFSRAGGCRTVEYRSGDDPALDREAAELVDRWAAGKQMVNPYVAVVKQEIAEGRLDRRHRVFLTYLDDTLVNAIVITKIPSENAYLLDVEFYSKDMPLGGLEFAITKIIEVLVAEGITMFSFGASFGVEVEDGENAAPDVKEALDELRSMGIFGEGNFQFKNKFRPANIPIYLCQPDSEDRTSVSDVILMIADPPVEAAPAEEGRPAEEPQDALAAHGHNPVRLPADQVETDLITDSWAELDSPFIRRRMRDLADRSADRPDAPELTGVSWLPFPLAVPTGSGRSAEALLCRSWPGPRGAVVHNGLFPTWYPSLVDAGFEPVQLPGSGGDVDTDALRQVLSERDRVSFVCVEVSNNAGGGYPASLENLRRVKELCTQYGVPLVIDGARIVENALFAADGDRPVWDVVSDILGLADCATVSLSKDFGVTSGGLVATRDQAVAAQLRERIATHGRDVDLATRKIIATALEDTDEVAAQVGTRMRAVAALWQRLADAGVPVVEPVAGHCVLLDVSRMEAFAGHDHPVMSCLAWMYRRTGVRGGPHLGREGLIRLAVPVGFGVERAEAVAARLAEAFGTMAEVPHLVTDGAGGAQAEYRPAETVPEDVQQALREQHRPDNDNLSVLREHNPRVEQRIVNGVEVFSAGSGPTLLLMTPFNIGAGVYAKQFESLTDRYRLVCVHHPGVGGTTAAADITLDGIATLCHDVLDEGFPVHVAGASFGGLSALAFALAYPGDTASLVLIGSSHRIGNRVGEINRLDVVAKEDFDHVIAESGSERLRGERDELQKILLRSESMDPQIGLRYLDVFAERPDFLARLPEIEVPTLIVQGRHDTVIPQKTAHLLHGAIPGAEYAEVADAGHFPQLSSADEVNGIIAGFLGRTR